MKKVYKKQILRYGEWEHPAAENGVLKISKDYLKKIVDNFKLSPFAPVTRGHVSDEEAEKNPNLIVNKNIKDLEIDDQGLNAVMEVDENELEKYNDVSVSIHPNYTDHESGREIGPLLRHVALVVNPYIKGLNPFLEMSDASNLIINLSDIMPKEKQADIALDDTAEKEEAVIDTPTTDEVVEEVDTTETTAEESGEVEEEVDAQAEPEEEETSKAEEEETEEVKEPVEEPAEVVEDEAVSDEEPVVDASESEAALKQRIAELEAKVSLQDISLAEKNAEAKFAKLSEAGKVTPAVEQTVKELYKSATTEIALSDGNKKSIGTLLDELFEKMPQVINFEEKGFDTESMNVSEDLVASLRKIHKNKTDAEFEAYLEKNKNIILEEQAKLNK